MDAGIRDGEEGGEGPGEGFQQNRGGGGVDRQQDRVRPVVVEVRQGADRKGRQDLRGVLHAPLLAHHGYGMRNEDDFAFGDPELQRSETMMATSVAAQKNAAKFARMRRKTFDPAVDPYFSWAICIITLTIFAITDIPSADAVYDDYAQVASGLTDSSLIALNTHNRDAQLAILDGFLDICYSVFACTFGFRGLMWTGSHYLDQGVRVMSAGGQGVSFKGLGVFLTGFAFLVMNTLGCAQGSSYGVACSHSENQSGKVLSNIGIAFALVACTAAIYKLFADIWSKPTYKEGLGVYWADAKSELLQPVARKLAHPVQRFQVWWDDGELVDAQQLPEEKEEGKEAGQHQVAAGGAVVPVEHVHAVVEHHNRRRFASMRAKAFDPAVDAWLSGLILLVSLIIFATIKIPSESTLEGDFASVDGGLSGDAALIALNTENADTLFLLLDRFLDMCYAIFACTFGIRGLIWTGSHYSNQMVRVINTGEHGTASLKGIGLVIADMAFLMWNTIDCAKDGGAVCSHSDNQSSRILSNIGIGFGLVMASALVFKFFADLWGAPTYKRGLKTFARDGAEEVSSLSVYQAVRHPVITAQRFTMWVKSDGTATAVQRGVHRGQPGEGAVVVRGLADGDQGDGVAFQQDGGAEGMQLSPSRQAFGNGVQ